MLVRWISCLCVCLILTGCGQTPTSPSPRALPAPDTQTPTASAASAATSSAASADTLPITVVPPRALGVTRYLAFGDSITWGAYSSFFSAYVYAAANGGYPERLQANLALLHAPQQFSVFNDGLPGELALNALPRFRASLTARRPEAVLLLEGINDLSNDIAPTRVAAALFQLVDTATAQGIPVLVATMFPTYAVTDPDGFSRPNGSGLVPAFNAEIRRLAVGRLNVHLVDLEAVMRDRSFVGNDGIHLTDAGFDVMATAFRQRIEAVFPVRGSFQ